jgi:hypothetical protein
VDDATGTGGRLSGRHVLRSQTLTNGRREGRTWGSGRDGGAWRGHREGRDERRDLGRRGKRSGIDDP